MIMSRIILLMLFLGCSSNLQSYKIIDRDNEVHSYNREITRNNTPSVFYCKKHYQLERVRFSYRKEGVKIIVRKAK